MSVNHGWLKVSVLDSMLRVQVQGLARSPSCVLGLIKLTFMLPLFTQEYKLVLVTFQKGVEGLLHDTGLGVKNFCDQWKYKIKTCELWMFCFSWVLNLKVIHSIFHDALCLLFDACEMRAGPYLYSSLSRKPDEMLGRGGGLKQCAGLAFHLVGVVIHQVTSC